MTGLSLAHPCGCCRPAGGHTVRVNQGPRQIQNQASLREVWVLVLGSFMFLSAVSLVLLSFRS